MAFTENTPFITNNLLQYINLIIIFAMEKIHKIILLIYKLDLYLGNSLFYLL